MSWSMSRPTRGAVPHQELSCTRSCLAPGAIQHQGTGVPGPGDTRHQTPGADEQPASGDKTPGADEQPAS